jgi:L-asparaginase II
MKPIQAMALVESGALEALRLGEDALALACASHNGEPFHVAVVDAMLGASGLTPLHLGCGVHPPFSDPKNTLAYERMIARGEHADARHNNCSGKHAGMLVASKHRGLPLDSYLDPWHPHQVRVRSLVSAMSGAPPETLIPCVDGCSAPIYALTLSQMATAYARLANPPAGLAPSCSRIVKAMTTHPMLVHGTGGFDSDLMTVAGDRVLSKRGAEGVACMALLREGWGVAIKAADGAGRATPPAAVEVLKQLRVLDPRDLAAMAGHAKPVLKNSAHHIIGEIRPAAFALTLADGKASA